ncbi:hypothetical protein ACFQU1_17860 [Chelatococcus sp. GCM10030263]|uniref:hypothetical protein n=1 Tax=Chelatococcus sp. GCM10030263 TaxID=3273387 RepID=UPI0036124DE4
MSMRTIGFLAGAAISLIWVCAVPAQALTMQECSAKYKAAEAAGTLNGMKWNDFRKAQCGSDASAAAPAAASTANPGAPAAARSAAAPAAATTNSGSVVFPTSVSTKYADQPASKARMHTCLDQYKVNKASGGNGSLRWVQKGGGYYSECNKRLKGA